MADKTTEGVQAEPAEVEALLHSLFGFHLAERDPLQRYHVLTHEQVVYDALVAAIRRERGRALAELVRRGHSMAEVAAMTNLHTRARVQRLIAFSRGGDELAPAVSAGSQEFEEKLAAVEATLDEVHADTPAGPRPRIPRQHPLPAPAPAPAATAMAAAAIATVTAADADEDSDRARGGLRARTRG